MKASTLLLFCFLAPAFEGQVSKLQLTGPETARKDVFSCKERDS